MSTGAADTDTDLKSYVKFPYKILSLYILKQDYIVTLPSLWLTSIFSVSI